MARRDVHRGDMYDDDPTIAAFARDLQDAAAATPAPAVGASLAAVLDGRAPTAVYPEVVAPGRVRSPRRSLRLRWAVATAAFGVGAGSLGIAGALPDPVQRQVSRMAEVVGVDLPDGRPATTTTTITPPTTMVPPSTSVPHRPVLVPADEPPVAPTTTVADDEDDDRGEDRGREDETDDRDEAGEDRSGPGDEGDDQDEDQDELESRGPGSGEDRDSDDAEDEVAEDEDRSGHGSGDEDEVAGEDDEDHSGPGRGGEEDDPADELEP